MTDRPRYLANQLRRQAAQQRRWRAQGRCVRCGKKLALLGGPAYARCAAHRRENAWHQKLSRLGLAAARAHAAA